MSEVQFFCITQRFFAGAFRRSWATISLMAAFQTAKVRMNGEARTNLTCGVREGS